MISITRTVAIALVAAVCFSASVRAETVSVLSAGAVQSAMVDLIATHSVAQGADHKVAQEYMPVGPLMRKLTDGAKPDVIILSEEAMVGAVEKGFVDKESIRVVGRVGIGVAIKTGATSPDIATPEALKATLLAAKSIVYIDPTRGTSGKHFAGVIESFGIADALRAKTTLGSGGYVVEPVGRGEVELGIHQITEILPVKGVTMIGPLPAAVQKITVYVAGVGRTAINPVGAKALIAHATGEQAQRVLATKGFMAPK